MPRSHPSPRSTHGFRLFQLRQHANSLDGVIDQDKLLHVADVDAQTLGQAYHAMQNRKEEWVDHPRVTIQPGLEETFARSLSAGDVLELDGQRYLLLVVGYHPLQPGDTKGPTAAEAFQADLNARRAYFDR